MLSETLAIRGRREREKNCFKVPLVDDKEVKLKWEKKEKKSFYNFFGDGKEEERTLFELKRIEVKFN
jgi:hypothetical protein